MRVHGVPRRRNQGFTIVELIVVMALIVVLIALLAVGIQKVRNAAARVQSTNNVKQIVLAFHGFDGANKRLPYNGTAAAYQIRHASYGGPAVAGNVATGSWAFMILPYLDQEPLFAQRNTEAGVAVFLCPGRARPLACTGNHPGAWTDYFINSFLNDPNGAPGVRDSKHRMTSIIDGVSNTIFVGQGQIRPDDYPNFATTPGFTDIIFNGGSAGLCRPNTTVVLGRDSSRPASLAGNWGGPFALGALMGMGDGSARWFPYTMAGGTIGDGECTTACDATAAANQALFGNFLTPSGGELGAREGQNDD